MLLLLTLELKKMSSNSSFLMNLVILVQWHNTHDNALQCKRDGGGKAPGQSPMCSTKSGRVIGYERTLLIATGYAGDLAQGVSPQSRPRNSVRPRDGILVSQLLTPQE